MAKNTKKFLINYTLLFVFIAVITLGYLYIHGHVLTSEGDALSYGMGTNAYTRRWWSDILNGNFPEWYSFTIGFGNNTLETMVWSYIGDPLSLLLLLGPKNCSCFIGAIRPIIYIYFAGIFAGWVFLGKGQTPFNGALLGNVYVFTCFYVNVLLFGGFGLGLVALPLIVDGIDKVISEKRISKRMVFGCAYLALCSGFYFFYIVLFFAGIYFAAYVIENFVCYIKNSRDVATSDNQNGILKEGLIMSLKDCLRGLGCVLLGGGVATPVLVPSLMSFFKSQRTGFLESDVKLSFFKDTFNFLKNICSSKGLAIPVLIVCLFLVALFSKRVPARCKFMAIFCMIIYPNSRLGLIINGGANDRWAFAIIFFILLVVAELGNIEEYISDRWKKFIPILQIIVIINIIVCQLFTLSENSIKFGGNAEYELIESETFDIPENDQYRSDIYWKNSVGFANGGMYYNDYQCCQYLSLHNVEADNFFNKYYLFAATANGNMIRGLDERTLMEDIFAVKYYYDTQNDEIILNDDCMKWATVYDTAVTEDYFEELTPIQRYDLLSKAVVLSADDCEKYGIADDSSNIATDAGEKIPVYYNGQIAENITAKAVNRIELQVGTTSSDEEIYLSIKEIAVSSDRKVYNITVDGRALDTWKDIFIKVHPDDEGMVYIDLDEDVEYEITDISAYKYNTSESVRLLNEKNQCQDVYVTHDSVEGTVEGAGRIICFPIFYDSNWVATINGETVPVIRMNNGLMGIITIDEVNNYSIGYKYIDTMLPCLLVSILCCAIIIVLWIMKVRRDKANSIVKEINTEKE